MALPNYFSKMYRYPFNVLIIGWTILIVCIVCWIYDSIYTETFYFAKKEAYKGVEKDVMYRAWATEHGGVYVPLTGKTLPNPYLQNVPERDVVTPSKRILTLMNPAYMTREVLELSSKRLGLSGHITSLNPIRKENEADEWETTALKSFEKGQKEFAGVNIIIQKKYFRYMAPLITEKNCLKCHEKQGYKVGDIRGGISSTVPWNSYDESITRQTTKAVASFGILWLLGLIGISIVNKKSIKSEEGINNKS